MLESELAKAKAKGKVIGVFKIDLDKMRDEINLLKEKLDKEKANALEEKNGLLEHHNQMIDTNKNHLNKNNMFLLEKMRNMDQQID